MSNADKAIPFIQRQTDSLSSHARVTTYLCYDTALTDLRPLLYVARGW
jgi:hypothetical protein